MIRAHLLYLATLMLFACSEAEVRTDGSPEANLVATWLSSYQLGEWFSPGPIRPGAPLIMSDYGIPLTLSTLRRNGPDRLPGCALARVERVPFGVMATWSCATHVDLIHRQVEFQVRNGRIHSANYIEGIMAEGELGPPLP